MALNKKDAAKETDTSSTKVTKAWHDAKDDAVKSGELSERNENKVKDSEHGPELHKIFKDAGMVGDKDKKK